MAKPYQGFDIAETPTHLAPLVRCASEITLPKPWKTMAKPYQIVKVISRNPDPPCGPCTLRS